MKGVILYYSSTGNTELACRFIASRTKNIDFDLVDIAEGKSPDLEGSSLVGFAFPTFYMGIPEVFKRFISLMVPQKDKPAFILNTYGMMQGKALETAGLMLRNKGFRTVAYLSLMMPENYPPFIAKGWGNRDQPDEHQMKGLNDFIAELSEKAYRLSQGGPVSEKPVKVGFLNKLIGEKTREKILKSTGDFIFDTKLCTKCESPKCIAACPYDALTLAKAPAIDKDRCWGCWSCFNHCPSRAISTKKINSASQYAAPEKSLIEKLT